MFAKSTLASAVAAALGVSAVGIAHADSVFFPQVVLSDTVTTIVSVVNTSAANWDNSGTPGAPGTNLHYRFYYKSGAAAGDQLATCEEYDEYLPTSQNDVQSIDLSGHFGSDTAGVLFKDPSINNKWKASGRDYALGRNVTPARGYLYVDNQGDPANDEESLSGEAFVFEFGSGAAWGYEAYKRDGLPHTGANGGSDYSEFASESPANVSILPFDEITTAFFVTPVDFEQAPDFTNNYRARIELVTTRRGDLYDRDENLVSGTVVQDVVCVARINAVDLLTDGTLARLVDGGWGKLWNYRLVKSGSDFVPAVFDTSVSSGLSAAPSKFDSDAGAVVIKLEYNLGGTFNEEKVGGTYNNAILIAPNWEIPVR